MIDVECECCGLPEVEYAANDLVIEEGKRSNALYFLKSGKVRVYRGGILMAELSAPGTVLGEISVLLDRPHIAEVRAAEDCVFHVARDAAGYLKEHPEVNLHICKDLARKVDMLGCYLADLKKQYGGEEGHLGMMHEVLDSMMHG